MKPMPQGEQSPMGSVGATRKLMEHTARKILLQTKPNVTLQCGAVVSGLRFSDGSATVSGTHSPHLLQDLGSFPCNSEHESLHYSLFLWSFYLHTNCTVFINFAGVVLKSGEEVAADLVVDASGRSSMTSKWLEVSGHSAPPETVINSGLGYGTRTYKMPPNWYQKHVRLWLASTLHALSCRLRWSSTSTGPHGTLKMGSFLWELQWDLKAKSSQCLSVCRAGKLLSFRPGQTLGGRDCCCQLKTNTGSSS